MAVGTALAVASIVMTAAGTVMKARAQKKAAAEEARAAEFQAGQYERNAAQADREAVDAIRRGSETGQMLSRSVRRSIGSQRAAYAGQGVDVGVGTAAAVPRQTEALLQSDLARITRNAEREAMGYKTEAADLRQSATFARTSGRYALAAGRSAAIGTILGGAADTSLQASRLFPVKVKDKGGTP